jgi:hypothetical protein
MTKVSGEFSRLQLIGVMPWLRDRAKSESDEAALKAIFNPAQLKQIDKRIAKQPEPAIDRHEAIRRLVELGLKAKAK